MDTSISGDEFLKCSFLCRMVVGAKKKNSYGGAADGSHYMLGNLEQKKSIGLEWEENFRLPGFTISTKISSYGGAADGSH